MSTLGDEVQNAYSSEYLKNLTNPDDAAAPSVDTTQLERAVTRATSMFQRLAQVVFDDTDDAHLEAAILCVEAKLLAWGAAGTDHATAIMDRATTACESLRDTESRARIVPSSSSALTPSDENPTGIDKRPWSDDVNLDGLRAPTTPVTNDRVD